MFSDFIDVNTQRFHFIFGFPDGGIIRSNGGEEDNAFPCPKKSQGELDHTIPFVLAGFMINEQIRVQPDTLKAVIHGVFDLFGRLVCRTAAYDDELVHRSCRGNRVRFRNNACRLPIACHRILQSGRTDGKNRLGADFLIDQPANREKILFFQGIKKDNFVSFVNVPVKLAGDRIKRFV